MKRTAIALLAILPILSSCQLLQDNSGDILDAGKAGALVLTADELAIELADYIAGDEQAIEALLMPDGPVDYALRVADFMRGNMGVPVVDVVVKYPEYLAAFKQKMVEGREAVVDYSERTGRAIPVNLQLMWMNGVDAIRLFDKAKEAHDETFKVSQVYAVIEPYVRLGLLLKGVPI